MPLFNSINFYQNRPKITLFFAKKIQNFRVLGFTNPSASGARPQTPVTPPLQISDYATGREHIVCLYHEHEGALTRIKL